MAEVLKGPVYGTSGVRYPTGHAVPTTEPDWFIADLRAAGQIVDETPPVLAPDPVASETEPPKTAPRKGNPGPARKRAAAKRGTAK